MTTRISNKDPTGRMVPITCQDDTVSKKQSKDLNPGRLTPEATCSTTMLSVDHLSTNITILMGQEKVQA